MPPFRWFAVGSADASVPDPGTKATAQALLYDNPKLLIVFCSSRSTCSRSCVRSALSPVTCLSSDALRPGRLRQTVHAMQASL